MNSQCEGEFQKLPEEMKNEEVLEKEKPHIWIIDDNQDYSAVLMNTLSTIENVQMESFTLGEVAVEKIKTLINDKKILPELIFMDYRLNEGVERPKYAYGTDATRDIVKTCEENHVKIPNIIAFSTDSLNNEKLLNSGATTSLKKGRITIKELKEFISQNIKS